MQAVVDVVGQTKTVITAAVARIHSKLTEEFSFKYTKLFGVLCIVYDRLTKQINLKMYHPQTKELIYRMRLKPSFQSSYKIFNPFFMYFNYKNLAIGFSFADSDDLSNFELAL